MKLRAIASAFPTTRYSAADVASWTQADPDFVAGKVGVASRAFLGPDERALDLAIEATNKLLANTGVSPDSIDLLIYVTQTPEYGIPHNSALLQQACGLRKSLAAFDMGLGCSGFPYAMATAQGLMQAQNLQRGLIITCDPYSKIMDRHDKNTVTVFGDAATATLLDSEGSGTLGACDFGTDGSGKEALIIPAGRGARPLQSIHGENPGIEGNAADYRLHMKGRAVFNFVLKNIPASLERALELNGLTRDQIRAFAIHQGSQYMLEQLAARAEIPPEKLLLNLRENGNTVSSSVPLLLEQYMASPEFGPGPVLISGFGVGLSWCSSVITFS